MGACTFMTTGRGKTAHEAFRDAREQALHENGYGGYSGTIAEKMNFVMIPFYDKLQTPYEYADFLIGEGDPRIDDKWGPAGCIKLGNDEYLFFGWASE